MSTAAQENPSPLRLVVGDVIGGRFRVESPAGMDMAGELYRAFDVSAKRAVFLRLFPVPLIGDEEQQKALRGSVKRAAQISYPNLAAIYGMGKFEDTLYLAGEFVEGLSLADHVLKRKSTGSFFPLVGLQKAFSPLVGALSHAHSQDAIHGAVSARWVQVTEQGRVALRGLGFLSCLLEHTEFREVLQREGQLLAPEARGAPQLSPQTDVWGLGALFYELLTNQPLSEPYLPPSQIRADLPREFDGLLARCLAPDPAARFPNAEALAQAVNPIFARAAQPPKVVTSPAIKLPPPAGGLPPPRRSDDDTERWLLQKSGLDYGPYTGRQVKKQMEDGEIKEDTVVLDCENSQRKPIGDHEFFRDFVDDWRKNVAKREALQEFAIVDKAVQGAGTRRLVQIVLGVGLLAALVLGYYFLIPRVSDQGDEFPLLAAQIIPRLEDDFLWALKENRVPKPRASKRAPGSGGGSSGGGSSGGGSGDPGLDAGYNDSDVMSIDFDGPDSVGPKTKLTKGDLERGMRSVNGSLTACAKEEKRRSGSASFTVSFIVATDGKTRGIRLSGGSAALEKCVKGAVSRARFPASSSETPGSYSFGL